MSMKSRQALFDPNASPYTIPIDLTAPANDSADKTANISQGEDFWVTDVNFYNAGAASGDLQIRMRDEGGVFEFFKNWTNVDLVVGDGKDPFTMPAARRLRAGTTVTLSLKNKTGTARACQLVLIGYKTPIGYVPGEGIITENPILAPRAAGNVLAVQSPTRKTGAYLIRKKVNTSAAFKG